VTHSSTVVTSVHTADDPRIRYKTVGTLVDAGWDVTYVSSAPGPSDDHGFRSIVLSGTRIGRTLSAIRTMFSSNSDVTVVHDPELLPAAIALARMRGRNRVVFDLHEDLPRQLLTRRATPRPLRRVSAVASLWALRIAERSLIVTLAEPNYAWLFDREHPVFENLPIDRTLPKRRPRASGVVYVGDITTQRGVPLLVEAVGQLDGVRLTLVGRCPRKLEAELRSRAESLGVRLEMTGFLPYGEAWDIAADHLVGVSPLLDLPNYRLSLPTKIDEYRSLGLVAVVSDLPGSIGAIDDSEAALSFTAGDADALAWALDTALGDQERQLTAMREAPVVRATRVWEAERFADFHASLVTFSP
jgi:glycosyltransferase involved in cell wall biosynthesis